MKKFLILMLACTTATLLQAQIPQAIQISGGKLGLTPASGADAACNHFAGTVSIGPKGVLTQSNDLTLDTLFLCFNDSVFIDHNNDFTLLPADDPVSATPSGITYGFYTCPPTISGPTLQNIVGSGAPMMSGDPCRLTGTPAPPYGLYVTQGGNANGDIWFFNSGVLQTLYGSGNPVNLTFAPITIDNFLTKDYEVDPNNAASPPGPCVNLNTAADFVVYYLNQIEASNLTLSYNGFSCMARFRVQGGYPEVSPGALYTMDIHLKSDPSVKALISTQVQQMTHFSNIIFSVPQSGVYVINIEDGKSCGFSTEVDMTVCDPSGSVEFNLQDLTVEPGEQFCIPVTTNNFDNLLGFGYTLNWDPTVMQLQPGAAVLQNVNPLLVGFDYLTSLNVSQGADGKIGINFSGPGTPFTFPDNTELFSICFTAQNVDSICTPLFFNNDPALVYAEQDDQVNGMGSVLIPLIGNAGEICLLYDTIAVNIVQIPGCSAGETDARITVTGGQEPYELFVTALPAGNALPLALNINSGQPYTFTDLPDGQYRLIVTPLNGTDFANADTSFFEVTSDDLLGVFLDQVATPSCFNGNDGRLRALASLGTVAVNNPVTNGYTFAWGVPPTFPNPGNTDAINNAIAGFYSVTVTQVSTGCTALSSGTLTNPPLLDNGAIITTPATCTGLADGTLSYEIEGGRPINNQYNFVISYAESQGQPESQIDVALGNPYVNSALLPGFYRIVVTDSLGCTFTDSLTIAALRTVILTELPAVRPTCAGDTDGSVSVEVSITPPPPGAVCFFFGWSQMGTVSSTCTTSTITNIGAGTYLATAVDAQGCTDTLTVYLTDPPPFTVSAVNVTNPSCVNTTGGAISVTGLGGTGNPSTFTYDWAAPVTSTTNVATNLGEGIYMVTATDGAGCTAVYTDTLALPVPPVITGISTVQPTCGDDGSLTVNAATAISFAWSSPTGAVIGQPTNSTINSLGGGVYVVIVTDALSCTNTDTVTLTGVLPLSVSDTTLTDPSCFGYNDGSIAVGITGGNPGYTYDWPGNTPNSSILLTATAGTYVLTVTDTKNCTLTSTFVLNNPPQIQVLFTGATPTSCFENCDGGITLVTNYLQGSNFNFQWQDGSSDSVRVDLCSGLNAVTISSNNCFIDTSIVVLSPERVRADTAETLLTNVTCFGGSDGSVSMSAQGGDNGPFTYAWQTPTGFTGAINSGLTAGNYLVTITDGNGCTGVYTGVVTAPPPVSVSIATVREIDCAGNNSGIIEAVPSGGNTPQPGQTPWTYAWADPAGNQLAVTDTLSDIRGGVAYTVTVTDPRGCTGTTSATLTDPPAVVGQFSLGEPLQCFGDETTFTVNSITGGSGGPYTYTLDFGIPLDPALPSSIGGGKTYITYYDRQNCATQDSVDVPEPAEIIVEFQNPNDPTTTISSIEIELGDSLRLNPIISGATVTTFTWAPAEFVTDPTSLQTTLYTFSPGRLTLTVADEKGCIGIGTLDVEVDANRNVAVPNIFVPGNSLGENDYFGPNAGTGVERINFFRVYDRWGTLMYSQNDIDPSESQGVQFGWDGRYRGKFVDPGVYVYVAEARFLDGKVLIYRGDVTVIR